MEFNNEKSRVIHLDINSCFATIEQQANPLLRNKPVVVCAYTNPNGCILAASIDAKKLGIKTGMRVMDAKKIYPGIVTLLPDPQKYRFVHKKIKRILKDYSNKVYPKSIDEFVFCLPFGVDPVKISKNIKERIRNEVGEYITVSIGISTNMYLAKVASNLKKPDGLSEINKDNFHDVFSKLNLMDLTGIKKASTLRLRRFGIKTVMDFYNAPVLKLRLAFGGIVGFYWHARLHGFEIDDFKSKRVVLGNSYAPPPSMANKPLPIISKLCEKTGFRLRDAHLKASGVHLLLSDRNGNFWHMGRKLKKDLFDTNDIQKEILNLFKISPIKTNFRNIAISTFGFKSIKNIQLEIFEDLHKKLKLDEAIDSINKRYGLYTIHMGSTSLDSTVVQDRIAFGRG